MEKEYNLSSGRLQCFEKYAIFDFTGHQYDVHEANEFLQVVDSHYEKRKCVVISNRKMTKKINPDVYAVKPSKSVVGIAIVSNNDNVKHEAIQEQSLYTGVFSFFPTIEEAINWTNTVVK